MPEVRFGAQAAAARSKWDVRFTPESGHARVVSERYGPVIE